MCGLACLYSLRPVVCAGGAAGVVRGFEPPREGLQAKADHYPLSLDNIIGFFWPAFGVAVAGIVPLVHVFPDQ
jgi:hypothetical protein